MILSTELRSQGRRKHRKRNVSEAILKINVVRTRDRDTG